MKLKGNIKVNLNIFRLISYLKTLKTVKVMDKIVQTKFLICLQEYGQIMDECLELFIRQEEICFQWYIDIVLDFKGSRPSIMSKCIDASHSVCRNSAPGHPRLFRPFFPCWAPPGPSHQLEEDTVEPSQTLTLLHNTARSLTPSRG